MLVKLLEMGYTDTENVLIITIVVMVVIVECGNMGWFDKFIKNKYNTLKPIIKVYQSYHKQFHFHFHFHYQFQIPYV